MPFRNVSDEPARVLILSAPSCGLDQMFAELDAATAAGMPEFEKLAAITAKYGVTIEPPARERARIPDAARECRCGAFCPRSGRPSGEGGLVMP